MRWLTGRLAFLYGALFFELGVNLPFFPVWLRAQALDDAAIGIVLAAPLLVRIIANPVATAAADRFGRTGPILVACAWIVTGATALLGLASNFQTILAIVVLIAFAQGPLIALTDSFTLRLLWTTPSAELTYGRIRLWGSIAFAVANITAGWVLGVLSPASIVVMLVISAGATAIAAGLVAGGSTKAAPERSVRIGEPANLSLIGMTIAGAALVQASHAAVYGFSTLHWQSQGRTGIELGSLWALGIVSEVIVLALAGRYLGGRRGAVALLLSGAFIAVLRWAGMTLDPGLPLLVALQLAHGFTFAATHLGSIFLLGLLAPPSMQSQVQGWLAAAWAGIMAVLTSLVGQYYGTWGENVYGGMAVIAAIGLALLAAVALATRKGGAFAKVQ